MKPLVRPVLVAVVALMSLVLVAGPMAAQQAQQPAENGDTADHGTNPVWGEANWKLASRFAPYKMSDLTYSLSVRPRWIENSEKFWYEWESSEGKTFYIVDPTTGSKREIFDNDKIAAELTLITKDPYDGQHLPIQSIRFIDENTIQFDVTSSQDEEVEETEETEQEREQDQEEERGRRRERPDKKVHHFEYDVQTQQLRELEEYEEPDDHPRWASVSPDKQWVVFARNHNLFMMSYEDYERILDARRGLDDEEEIREAEEEVEVTEIQLTEDGVEHHGYESGFYNRGDTDDEVEEKADERKSASISWAKDSSRFAMVRQDRREVGDLWVIHAVGNERPQLESYKYDMPGEENVTQSELLVFDMQSREMKEIEGADVWVDQRVRVLNDSEFFYPDSTEPRITKWISDSSDELYFWRRSRDQHRVDIARADPTTGEVEVLIEERLNTYVEDRGIELLETGDMLWWSERDGWAHIYRFGPDGTLRNRLTEGPWSVRRIADVDEDNGVVFFVANAHEAGEDPYYQHLYRVNLDGSGLRLLNPGDFDHSISMGESMRYFVDNYSRVDTTPAVALMDRDGEMLLDLEDADMSALEAAGYEYPEPYRIKSADGVTDIYGVMYKPFDFDPTRKYPIVAYVYPGPQTESVAKAFRTSPTENAIAQLGMIVVTLGNRGGHPARSKWYHNYGYGNLRDYGLADKKAGIEQLAQRHAWIDVDRVGIYGHSGGGFMSTAAMLIYPDFFKVAVSSSGNHDNDVYNQNWSEKHDGVKEVVDDEGNVTFEYDIDRNSDLAKNLKGKLLLTTGDIDNNVHHAGTFRMADALIKANKRFDMFVFPGQRHGYRGQAGDYWFWLRAEYFAEHLLGATRPQVDIAELNVEREADRR